jgi:opacity protein-like surface antigen
MKATTSALRYFLPGRKFHSIFRANKKTFVTLTILGICFQQTISAQTDTIIRKKSTESTTIIQHDTAKDKGKSSPASEKKDGGELYNGEIGFRFLPTFTSLQFQTVDEATVRGEFTLGYGFGAMLAGNFNNNVGLQAEIIYNSLTQKYKDRELDRRIDISYINFPLMLSLNTDKSRPFNLNFVAGPQIGYNLGSKITTSGGGPSEADTVQAILAIKKGDFGFAYGAGMEFKLNSEGNFRFDLGFRGVYGLININDNSGTRTTNSYYILEKSRIKTNSIYMGFTFLF